MRNKLLVILGVLLALILIGIVLIPRLLNPNRYKDQIVAAVKNSTGRDLKISGELALSLLPLRLRLPEMELSNDPAFGSEPFAKIRSAAIDAKLMPLLHGNLVVNSASLNGVSINLARNKSGQNNWGSLIAPASGGKAEEPSPARKGTMPSFEIGSLRIKDAQLSLQDDANGEKYAIRHLNFETGRIESQQPVDLAMDADVEYGSRKSRIDFKTRILITGDKYQLQQLDVKLDDSHLTGAAEAQNPSHPIWKFDLALDQFDLDRYVPAQKEAASPPASASTEPSNGGGLNGDGSVRIGKFKAFGMQLTDITLQIHARNGEISLGPNAAKLYGGAYSGKSRIGPPGKVRKLELDETLTGIQIAPLLRDAAGITRYSGSAGVHVVLQGNSGVNLVRGMTGTVDVNLANGKIDGFDLLKIVNQASALVSAVSKKESGKEAHRTITSQPGDQTLFTALSATMRLSGGVARTDNIRLKGSALEASGAGSADLTREVVDYKLQVTVKDSSGKNVTVPVYVSGSFSDPKFGVDIGTLARQAATKEVKKEIDKLFKKKKPKQP